VPAPLSIFQGIQKLKPGVVWSIDQSKKITEEKFWDLESVIDKAQSQIAIKTDKNWIDELEHLLRDAVKRQMVADVPLGAFLSGGIDSSMVVALMQSQSTRPIQTFSIGFHEAEYNEAQYAAKVAKHLGTDHHELYLSAKDAMDIIPGIPNWCDEPFADSSQIPTFLVSQLAKRHVTVSLSGDGGDELFAGYNRYFVGQHVWQRVKHFPLWLRALGAFGIHQFSEGTWDVCAKAIPKRLRSRLMGDKIYKLASVLKVANNQDYYQLLVSQWDDPAGLVLGGEEPILYPWNSDFYQKSQDNFVGSMQVMDLLTYLPDDILAKVDRASMAVSLEARVPLLDDRLVEFSATLPMEMKIREGQGKWILRQVLNRYIPEHLFNRPKMGFGIPVGDWLKGPLREWAESLLSSERLKTEGILNEKPIRKRWLEHCRGERNWEHSLWGVLMFQAWNERWMGR
jgi:asparagine synthase (glutamine-hydrolysing)